MRNPIIPQKAGDPFILHEGDNYYMTATGGGQKGLQEFVCWHSKDLQHWSEPVTILELSEVTWAKTNAWAPSMVEKDGWYYFAFCADQQIGIAVCKEPMGRYRDLLGRPLIAKQDYDFQTIDPAFLKDADGQIYLAFGQGKCMVSRIELTPGSAALTGELVCLSDALYDQRSVDRKKEDKSIYNEAPDLIRIGDRYLFSWAIYDVADYRYGVRYAWSRSPMGPYIMPLDFDHDNILLQGRHDITGCGHACVTEYQGEYYIVYGRHGQNRLDGFGRDMCCEKITFEDELHLKAVPSRLG
ncbi:MAG: family 43 glycosylhydrolase [Eubacteriales bacterium]|nr:family 43 glycosylhydrolase [Eubacteriales bacterium]